MILVHDKFTCKPGNASKLAKLFKEMMSDMAELQYVMTDMTGEYNRVIMVTKYESLSAFEQSFEKYRQDTELMKKMADFSKTYQEMYLTGSREIFNIA